MHADSTYRQKKVQGGSLIRAFFFAENYISEQCANLVEYGIYSLHICINVNVKR